MDYDFEIEHEEMRKVNTGEIGYSGVLGPCISIGIYDKVSHSGYIATGIISSHNLIRKTLEESLAQFSNRKELKIAIAGANKASVRSKKSPEFALNIMCEDTWDELEKIISDYNFNHKQVHMYKEKHPDMVQGLYVDCVKGRVVVEKNPIHKD